MDVAVAVLAAEHRVRIMVDVPLLRDVLAMADSLDRVTATAVLLQDVLVMADSRNLLGW